MPSQLDLMLMNTGLQDIQAATAVHHCNSSVRAPGGFPFIRSDSQA